MSMSTSTRIAAAARARSLAPLFFAAALSLAIAACTRAPSVSVSSGPSPAANAQRFADREAIEHVLSRANIGFELSDPDMFASAFAEDAVYELASDKPVFGYQKLLYTGRADIRTIISDRVERARNTDPSTLSYDPASLRRYNRNSDELIEITGPDTARQYLDVARRDEDQRRHPHVGRRPVRGSARQTQRRMADREAAPDRVEGLSVSHAAPAARPASSREPTRS
jgi:hypothetical protein